MRQDSLKSLGQRLLLLSCAVVTVACSGNTPDMLNPYSESPPETLGERNNKAILGEGAGSANAADEARRALEVAASYQRTHAPQPYKPVVMPREVRLMWVPDHLNKAGDLVPAHYYYLRVLNDRWAVTDAFDIEQQLNQGSEGGATPWVYKNK